MNDSSLHSEPPDPPTNQGQEQEQWQEPEENTAATSDAKIGGKGDASESFTDSEYALALALEVGSDVLVLLGSRAYPGKVCKAPFMGEVGIETTAARHMSRHWKTLLFYVASRRSVYGIATLHIPGIDILPQGTIIEQVYERERKTPALLDEPTSRDHDIEDAGDTNHDHENDEGEGQKKETGEPKQGDLFEQ